MKTMWSVAILICVSFMQIYAMEEVAVVLPVAQAAQVARPNLFKRCANHLRGQLLLSAIQNDNIKRAHWCIKKGVNVNAQDRDGNTFLHYAASGLNIEILKAFLQAKEVNPTMYNHLGYTPVEIACENFKHAQEQLMLVYTREECKPYQRRFNLFLNCLGLLSSEKYPFNKEDYAIIEAARTEITFFEQRAQGYNVLTDTHVDQEKIYRPECSIFLNL